MYGWRQAIITTNAGILLIGPLGTNFSEILIEIYSFPFKKMHLKMSFGKWRPFLSRPQCGNTRCQDSLTEKNVHSECPKVNIFSNVFVSIKDCDKKLNSYNLHNNSVSHSQTLTLNCLLLRMELESV